MRSTRTILRRGCAQHRKIAILPQFRAIHTHDYIRVAPSTAGSQFYYSFALSTHTILQNWVAAGTARPQLYHSFVRSTRAILRKGCTGHRKIAILPQFRAIYTHDLTKGFGHRKIATLPQFRGIEARSYERVAPGTARAQFYHSFVLSACMILDLRKSCISGPWHPPLITKVKSESKANK